jgi:DMSO/TMAO reductase YedYZ molybdopterin-dependent catalytic subunit
MNVPRSVGGALVVGAAALVVVELLAGGVGAASPTARLADVLVEVAPGGLATWTVGTLRGLARPLTLAVAGTVLAVALGLVLRGLMAGPAGTPSEGDATGSERTVPRRSLGRTGAGVAILGAAAVVVGRRGGGVESSTAPSTVVLPAVPASLPPVTPAQDLAPRVPGLSPVLTPVAEFFRIDTAMSIPRVDAATWRLRIHGLVAREVTLTFDELMDLGLVERDVTISCVSNEVGGDLVGTQRWTGVPLRRVLDLAGPLPEATQLVGRSVDGWTAGFPTALAGDPDALVAVGMGGDPLPARHGFPARLVVAGLYGYVSATKWLTGLELTTWEAFDGFWIRRGWAKEGPVKTASRIDVPVRGREVPAGRVRTAGVAWAPGRGVAAVEVRVDGGPWRPAELSQPLADTAWVQWTCDLELATGLRRLEVRAVDGTGAVQPEGPRDVLPDGAEGWHRREVRAV